MKKVFIIIGIVIAAIILFLIFHKEEEKTFLEQINADIELVKDKYGNDYYCYYETEVEYVSGLDSTALEDIKIANTQSVFQMTRKDSTAYVVYLNRDFIKDEMWFEEENGHWGGTFSMDDYMDSIVYSYEEALICLKTQTKIQVPAGKFMTFRFPFGGYESHISYIFGSKFTSFAKFDAVTGELKE